MRHTTTAVLAAVAAVLSNFTSSFGVLASGVDDHAVVLGAHDHLPPTASSSSSHHHHAAGLSQPQPRLESPNLVARQSATNTSAVGCIDPNPQNTLTDRLNSLLNSTGPGYILSLCQGQEYFIDAPLIMSAQGQEISTIGYPIEQEDGTDLRATLVVNGPVSDGQGHTTAIDAQCNTCSDIKIRHLRINGTRGDSPPTGGGANIEIGGGNTGQLVEYVKSFDPRSWSCLHVFEGSLNCDNTTIRYNDIGPCGSDYYQYWADGISVACANSHVHGNWVYGATDGGIVLFGSPGTVVENNTVWVGTNTQLGGINMVDINPWGGNYTGTVVQNNTIIGGFATSPDDDGGNRGDNNQTAILKIGIAIGPRTWFGDNYQNNISFSGTVLNNRFSGGFGYAMGINSAVNFTVQGNTLFGNLSYIGTQGPNCTATPALPAAEAFVVDANRVLQSTIQTENMATVPSADSLTCIIPSDGNYWPYGGQPDPVVPGEDTPGHDSGGGGDSLGKKVGLGLGIPLAILAAAFLAWYFRKWFLARNSVGRGYSTGASGGSEMAPARRSMRMIPSSTSGYHRKGSSSQ